jgi:hypothetical protein
MVQGAITIQGDPLDTAQLPVDILDAAFAFEELLVLTCLASTLREKQGTLEALGAVAVGVIKLFGGVHGKANWAARRAVN